MVDLNLVYKNINLSIEKGIGKNSYAASFQSDNGAAFARNDFRYDIDASVITRLEDTVGKNTKRNAKLIEDFGGRLFNTVFKGKLLRYYRSLLNKHIRLKLLFNYEDTELLRVPWEFMFDGKNFLSANQKMTMSRALKGIPAYKKRRFHGKIRMLAVISNPIDLPESHRLHMEKERMIITQAVANAYVSDKIEIDFLHEASLRNIHERLYKSEYHIFHFTGHGIYSKKEQMCYLLLEDDFGSAKRVDHDTIAGLLAGHGSLRLAVLSGSQTAMSAGHRVLGDLPRPLLIRGIPAVLAMQYSVAGQSAMDLERKFYDSACNGMPIDLALTNARRELRAGGKQGLVDFATPVLYCDDPYCLQSEDLKSKSKK